MLSFDLEEREKCRLVARVDSRPPGVAFVLGTYKTHNSYFDIQVTTTRKGNTATKRDLLFDKARAPPRE
jgi:hypothetical protein